MQIVRYPHPALRFPSTDVTRIDAALRATVREMFRLMYEAGGIGLAANQVDLPLRVFIVNLASDPQQTDEELVFINPVITNRGGQEVDEEGCLSLPELYGDVRRPEQVTIEAFDLNGEGFRMKLKGLAARAVQHELDHLDGVLFIDRVEEDSRRKLAPRLAEMEAESHRLREEGTLPPDEEILERLRSIAGSGRVQAAARTGVSS